MEAQARLLESADGGEYRLPRLGSGVYAFSGYSVRKSRYKVWYIGRAVDLGGRFQDHLLKTYLNPGALLYLPRDPVAFLDGPQEYVSSETMALERNDFLEAERKKIARELVRSSHFCFAQAPSDKLVAVEAALHRIMRARYPSMKPGYLGDSKVPAVSDGFTIENVYGDRDRQLADFLNHAIGKRAYFSNGDPVQDS